MVTNIAHTRLVEIEKLLKDQQLANTAAQTMPQQAGQPGAASFQDMLTGLLKDVDKAQQKADVSMEQLVSGKPVSLQDVVLKMEEADLAFRMMKEVRDKLVTAYKEIMSTQA